MPLPLLLFGVLLGASYACLMLWYWYGWLNTNTSVNSKLVPQTSISVIIAARNEEQHIAGCIESILGQNYPAGLFEIIVVDDHSTDATTSIILSYERVKLVRQGIGIEGKKKAIESGINLAIGTLIVTTDADCTVSENWLATIVNYYEVYQPVMIAAPVYFKQPKGLLGIWQMLDFAGLMGITAAAIKNGLPQMCNGANLAYEKSAFEKVGGFEGIDGVPTGDDVLLMMKLHKQYPEGIHFLKSAEAIVWTQPQQTLDLLASQRLRWVSKSKVFPDWRVTAVLVLAYLFNLSIVVALISSFFYPSAKWLALALSGIKIGLEFPLLYGSLTLPRQRTYLLHILWVQLFHLLYVVVIGPLSLVGKYRWKGREY